MADGEKNDEEPSTCGNEWEVVCLTASAYAASPDPNKSEDNEVVEHGELGDGQRECLTAMVMSHHFVFTPTQQENLAMASDEAPFIREVKSSEIDKLLHQEALHGSEVCHESVSEVGLPSMHQVDPGTETITKTDEKLNFSDMGRSVKDFMNSNPFHEIPFIDEKGKKLPLSGESFKEVNILQGLEWIEPMQKLGSFYAETGTFKDTGQIADEFLKGASEAEVCISKLDYASNSEKPSKIIRGSESDGSDLPCQAWWKRQAASLYAQAREANAFWSVFVAAAVIGLVILGHHRQRVNLQVHPNKLQLNIDDKKLGPMAAPASRLKDVLLGQRRVPVLHYSNSIDL